MIARPAVHGRIRTFSESRKAIECMFSWEVVPEPFLQYPLVPKLGYTSCEKELPIQTAIMKIDIMDLL